MSRAAPPAVLQQALLTKVDWWSPLTHGVPLALLLGWRARRERLARLQRAGS